MAELQRLETPWDVDRHIVMEGEKVVLIRFSNFEKPPDEALAMYTSTKRTENNDSNSSSTNTSSDDSSEDNDSMEDEPFSSASHQKRNRGRMSKKHKKKKGSASEDGQISSAVGMEYYTQTQQMDEVLAALAPKVRKYCTMYLVSTVDVRNFNVMYELGHDREPFAVMFFYRNQHIRVDLGTGNNNKINFLMDEDDLLAILDSVYRAGKLGKTITSSEKRFNMVSLRR